MSQINPYSEPVIPHPPSVGRRISISPFNLLSRAWDFIKSDYWLFLGLVLVTVLIAGAVPFGIIMGPMMVGLWLCHLDREAGKKPAFDVLFRGFDSFLPSFLAFLIHTVFMMLVFGALAIVVMAMVAMILAVSGAAAGEEPNPAVVVPLFLGGIVFVGVPMMIVSVIMNSAMFFSFALIAERRLEAWESVTASYGAVFRNFWGFVGFGLSMILVSFVLMLLCFFPLFFFMPVMYAAYFLLYRDLFPKLSDAV